MSGGQKHQRSITPDGLACLLARLDADPDRAAFEYERLRLTLIRFFDWRGAWPPDQCADLALDRLARRLQEQTRVEDVHRYAHGIARLVLLEQQRQSVRTQEVDLASLAAVHTSVETDPLRECFDRCLAGLPAESRALVLQYYVAKRRAKIENRRRLAETLGISENALRSCVRRVRDRLERCAQTCADQAALDGLDAALRHVSQVPTLWRRRHDDD